jgi:hypothetical protein
MSTVFGPERPNAARRALEELRAAKAGLSTSFPSSPEYDRLAERVRVAREVRAQYYEYGDSLYGGDWSTNGPAQTFKSMSAVREYVEGLS